VPCGGMRQAPRVAAGTVLTADGTGSGGPAPESSRGEGGAPLDPRRAIAAGLLLAAGAVLVAGAVIGRRRHDDPEDPPSAGRSGAGEETRQRLTLVPVPNEAAPRA
jgi:hypothetical protein